MAARQKPIKVVLQGSFVEKPTKMTKLDIILVSLSIILLGLGLGYVIDGWLVAVVTVICGLGIADCFSSMLAGKNADTYMAASVIGVIAAFMFALWFGAFVSYAAEDTPHIGGSPPMHVHSSNPRPQRD